MSRRIDKIREMACEGRCFMDIRREVGGSSVSVGVALGRLRKKGLAPPPLPQAPRIAIPPDVFTMFEVVAEERGVDPRDLIREMLRVIADDDLFEAVSPARGGKTRS